MNDTLRRWQFTNFGINHLQQSEAPMPSPGFGQVLVRVEAASLNYHDLLVSQNAYSWSAQLPYVPASDMAGVVVAVGDELCNRVAEATNRRFLGDGKTPYTPPKEQPKF